ncbi:hypothetical protein COL24_21800 [Bacillus toyonensis]|uniref:hypothetical protein n=1 Tax=Bacillus toyonensis TaxID=155322 RepID=UPI000BF1A04F|nr:hypothetical protein [Bacillus toyonensis]PEL01124.1 hypothetical protein CN606_18415 [Bacillus toyonensis]PEO23892.1 hypothetical protein CN589_31025 [Bacillus toyonensis]PFX37970.1 hypothetical protein COL24_21800 [Bacillus toyonensis]PFY06242.1 hypothetical protein COL45_02230 [Bacillus toyonensis]PGB05945.1 hypothetical protein COM09_33990 [Bacillus toyonensis]
MKTLAKKEQMIRLQGEENCKRQADAEQYNAEQCNIERECIKQDKKSVKNQTTEEKWDERCKQAVQLFNQGTEYPDIAKIVGCKVSSLYRELKKRGVLEMPKQAASSKTLRSPIIPAKTKKSKFERYKEYYMYK